MIDTVRLKVLKSENSSFYNFCLENSNQQKLGFIVSNAHSITDVNQKRYIFKTIEYEDRAYQIINGNVYNPSSTYHAFYQIKEDYIIFELSLPKFIYGTNVFQFINHQTDNNNAYRLFILGVKYFFDTLLLPCPEYEKKLFNFSSVVIERFDICFNQYFKSKNESLNALKMLKMKSSKTSFKQYNTGLTLISKTSYQKIYHKGEEFKKKDQKHFSKLPISRHQNYQADATMLDKIIELSDRCLRYEKQCKPSNWSYLYMTNYSVFNKYFQGYKAMRKNYDKLNATERKRFRTLEKIFKNTRIKFTLGQTHLNEVYRNLQPLREDYFNKLVNNYLCFIREYYTINGNTINTLKKSIVENTENKTMNVRILGLINTFGSLEKAKKEGAVSNRTFDRYKAYLTKSNLSTTNTTININQDWSNNTYLALIREYGINLSVLNKTFY